MTPLESPLGVSLTCVLTEKCIEQQYPLNVVLIDLTKVFDLVSRIGLFGILRCFGMYTNQQYSVVSLEHTCICSGQLFTTQTFFN